jgi:hypothetical protein
MVDEGNYGAAATLLHSLLWSKLAPKYFWVTLLMDAIPFLTADELLFTSEQTYELLQCLQVGCILEFFSVQIGRLEYFVVVLVTFLYLLKKSFSLCLHFLSFCIHENENLTFSFIFMCFDVISDRGSSSFLER